MSTVGTLGWIHMWNYEDILNEISEYYDLKEGYVKAGSCIALGLANTGVRDENDTSFAFLTDALALKD